MDKSPDEAVEISRECRKVLRDPVYSPELCARLIGWLREPNAAVSDIAGRCLIKLGLRAFDDLLAYVASPGETIWPKGVWVLTEFPERYDQMLPLVRSWLADGTGDLEEQCAVSLACILVAQRQAGLAPAPSDIDVCRQVMSRNAKTSLYAQFRLRSFETDLLAGDNP